MERVETVKRNYDQMGPNQKVDAKKHKKELSSMGAAGAMAGRSPVELQGGMGSSKGRLATFSSVVKAKPVPARRSPAASPPSAPPADDEAIISPPAVPADDDEALDDELDGLFESLAVDGDDGLDDIFKRFGVDGESSALGQFEEEREAKAAVSRRPSCSIVSDGDGRRTSPFLVFGLNSAKTEDAPKCEPEPSDHKEEECFGFASYR